MKKIIFVSMTALIVSLPAMANSVNPSSGTSVMNPATGNTVTTEESTTIKSSSKPVSNDAQMMDDSTSSSRTTTTTTTEEIEAQEDVQDHDKMNHASGATTEEMESEE